MKVVIDIDEKLYDELKTISKEEWSDERLGIYQWMIVKGTPLPKGHGRLKDVDWIDDNYPAYRTEDGAWCYKWEDIDNAQTIIEAESEDKNNASNTNY